MLTREEILDNLKRDYNYYYAEELQKFVEYGMFKWEELCEFYSEKEIDAIQANEYLTCRPISVPQEKTDDAIEIYFWGSHGSGKTCAIDAIMTIMELQGPIGLFKSLAKLKKEDLRIIDNYHQPFRMTENNCAILQDTVDSGEIHETMIIYEDDTKRKHRVSLIEVPLVQNRYCEVDVDQIMSSVCRMHQRGSWMFHFFVKEYGYMDSWAQWRELTSVIKAIDEQKFLQEHKTLGAYVLVTKMDRIEVHHTIDIHWFLPPFPNEKHPIEANNYVDDLFWKTLKKVCKKYRVYDVKKIAFTIGQVFAKDRCFYVEQDTLKVINLIVSKLKQENLFARLWKRFFNKEPEYL